MWLMHWEQNHPFHAWCVGNRLGPPSHIHSGLIHHLLALCIVIRASLGSACCCHWWAHLLLFGSMRGRWAILIVIGLSLGPYSSLLVGLLVVIGLSSGLTHHLLWLRRYCLKVRWISKQLVWEVQVRSSGISLVLGLEESLNNEN